MSHMIIPRADWLSTNQFRLPPPRPLGPLPLHSAELKLIHRAGDIEASFFVIKNLGIFPVYRDFDLDTGFPRQSSQKTMKIPQFGPLVYLDRRSDSQSAFLRA